MYFIVIYQGCLSEERMALKTTGMCIIMALKYDETIQRVLFQRLLVTNRYTGEACCVAKNNTQCQGLIAGRLMIV